MGRTNKVEACIFCGEAPCACNKPADRPKTQKVEQPKADAPKSKFKASKIEPPKFEPRKPSTQFKASEQDRVKSQDDLALEAAIRNLEPLLADSEKRRYDKILNPPIQASIEKQLIDWRERHGILPGDA